MKKLKIKYINLKTNQKFIKIYKLNDNVDIFKFLKNQLAFFKALSNCDHAIIF